MVRTASKRQSKLKRLSETVEHLRSHRLGAIDYAVIEAAAITEEGGIVPSTSIGNSASFAILAKKIIVEIKLSQLLELEGLHDVYIPTKRPSREPIPVVACDSRVDLPYVLVDPEKVAAIVITGQRDSFSTVEAPDAETEAIADHLIHFFEMEVSRGRLDLCLRPLQAGSGQSLSLC